MLRKLSIAGFKSIKKQDIELGRLNVLIGQNGAGKSNVLEAVGMLSAALDGAVNHATLRTRGVRQSTPSVYRSALRRMHRPKYFDLSAEFDDLKYHCNIFTSDEKIRHESAWTFHSESFESKSAGGVWKKVAGRSAHGAKISKQSIPKEKIKPTDSIAAAVELLSELSPRQLSEIVDLKNFAIYAPSTSILRGEDSDSNPKEPLGLNGGGLPDAVADVMNSSSHGEFSRFFKILSWYRSFSIELPRSELKSKHVGGRGRVLSFSDQFMNNDFNKLYSYDVSEGALYVTFIIALMTHPKSPKIFALDNVDSTLNPGLVRSIVTHIGQLAKKLDKQVLLTTHNPTALDALDLFNPDHILYVVDRGESGETELTRLQPDLGMTREGWEEQFGGTKLSELWIDGLIGGVTPGSII